MTTDKKIEFGDLPESVGIVAHVVSYGKFVALDMVDKRENHHTGPVVIISNISVEEAKRVRDALDDAIQPLEKETAK